MVCLKCDYRRPKASNTSDTSAQPRHDNGGYHNKSEVTDINDQPSVGQNKKSLYKDSNTWRFVEDSDDYARSRSRDEDSGFVDFPIAGGKSDLSQNAQRRERWKLEMQERSKGTIRARPEDDEFRSAHVPRTRHFPESADDDEMADWFGHGNTETKMHVQVPD